MKLSEAEQIITRAYLELLGRPPDKKGRWGKIQSLLGGMSEEEMRQAMMQSIEYKKIIYKHGQIPKTETIWTENQYLQTENCNTTIATTCQPELINLNENPPANIKLTVGLPLYRAKNIAWVAFESLCRQQSIDFGWELIVIEENVEGLLPFGKDNVLSYTGRLEEAGCKKIIYVPVSQWTPLSSKWFDIVDRASSESICMLLQSADCYSSPGRLKETLRLFESENADWVHSRIHVIYNISDEKIVLYDHIKAGHNCGSDMAIRISVLKSLHSSARRFGEKIRSGVDGFLYKQCQLIKKDEFAVFHDTTDNWKHSININGMNNISNRKVLVDRLPDNSNVIKHLIPEDILERLQKLKEFL